MLAVLDTHPSIVEHLAAGDFVVQQRNQYSFSQTSMDQSIKQAMNRDSKTRDGQIEFSNNANAVHHWILSFNQHVKSQEAALKWLEKQRAAIRKKTLLSPNMRRMKQAFILSCIQLSCCKIHRHIMKKNL